MAISIVSDLVLDVVKAANPERVKIAQAGLQHGKPVAEAAKGFASTENAVRRNAGIGRFLSTDIVGEVINAADPAKLEGGVARLAGPSESAPIDMASLVLRADETSPDAFTSLASAVNPKAKAYQQFEASVLRNFVEEMLPKATENTYGEGTAGNVWRSMQADFMSQELAKSGGIGIAATLARLDEAKVGAQAGMTLNEITPRADGARDSIVHASEWPYFSRSAIGGLES